MVLGQVRPLLEANEIVTVWAHVHTPNGDRPGLLTLTGERCLVHWSARDEATVVLHWAELTAWEVSVETPGGALLTMVAGGRHIEVRLPLSTGSRAQNATRVVDHVTHHAPSEVRRPGADRSEPLTAEPRGWRGHVRRVVITVVGLLVVLLSAVFASPFVPGPGALTFLAGLTILAKEYDWARDVHLWVKRGFDRVRAWYRAKRRQRRERRRDRRVARSSAQRRVGAEVRDLAEARAAANRAHPGDTEAGDPPVVPHAQSE